MKIIEAQNNLENKEFNLTLNGAELTIIFAAIGITTLAELRDFVREEKIDVDLDSIDSYKIYQYIGNTVFGKNIL